MDTETETKNDKIREVALEMFRADHLSIGGVGFDQDDAWWLAYAKLQKLIGYKEETSALGENDDFNDLPDA